jgi:hypothetical protein
MRRLDISENSHFHARLFCERRAKRSRDRSPPDRFSTFLLLSWKLNPKVDIIPPTRS